VGIEEKCKHDVAFKRGHQLDKYCLSCEELIKHTIFSKYKELTDFYAYEQWDGRISCRVKLYKKL